MNNIAPSATITTARLRLEPFAMPHAAALNAINNEPAVMEFLSSGEPETLELTKTVIERVRIRWETRGYSWWAIILRETEQVIGAACAQPVANVDGAEIEIGWRLATSATGNGYATEAGKAAADYVFDVVGADHVVAVADPKNTHSHKVMDRVGMTFRGIETHYDEPCTTYVLKKNDRRKG